MKATRTREGTNDLTTPKAPGEPTQHPRESIGRRTARMRCPAQREGQGRPSVIG